MQYAITSNYNKQTYVIIIRPIDPMDENFDPFKQFDKAVDDLLRDPFAQKIITEQYNANVDYKIIAQILRDNDPLLCHDYCKKNGFSITGIYKTKNITTERLRTHVKQILTNNTNKGEINADSKSQTRT